MVVSIQNSGPMISAETRNSLFDPLVRGVNDDKTGVNLGLGLYIVREIALAHGGSVTVESTKDRGTVFEIRVPRKADAREASAFAGLHMS